MVKTIIQTVINEDQVEFTCEPFQTLLEVLRDDLKMTGTKEGCGNGNCGACNVIIDNVLVNSCLVLAVEVHGNSITTIEGIASRDSLHPLQQVFLEEAALQCGICTPGFIVSAKKLLDINPHPTEYEIRKWLSGNLCRCTGYDKIIKAIMSVPQR